MMPAILAFMEQAVSELALPVGKVLEVGSLNVNGTARTVFQHRALDYIGIDAVEGNCVDFVMDAETLLRHFPKEHFDTVVCCEMLEHAIRPWRIVEQMKALLKPSGLLWISAPTFGFPLHRFPYDCYRFGEDAFRLWMFADMELLRLAQVEDALQQPALVAVGQKPQPSRG